MTMMMERQESFHGKRAMERQKSFIGLMEQQRSLRLAMEKQDSPGKRGDSFLHLAARASNLIRIRDVMSRFDSNDVKELLAKQNQEGETPLYVAAENGHVSVVSEFLKHLDLQTASIVARNGSDPFHIAAKQGHLDVLKELLKSFPNMVMTTDAANSTALHTAAAQGHVQVVDLLLEANSNLAKIARNNGKTVLHTAARMGYLEVARSILSKDSSIGLMVDKKGQTALHMAVKGQNAEIVQELIKPDSNVLILEDAKGNTALHVATRKGKIEIIRALMSVEGVDVKTMNKAGETPLDIAEKIGNQEIAAVIREAGGVNGKPQNPAKQLKKTVSDIKHDVESQLRQTRQTGFRVRKIAKKVKKLHTSGLNNAINSATVVAVLIATVAFAAIFTVPGQYVQDTTTPGFSMGQAHIAKKAAFIIFFVSDSLALFISLAVVVVQTSVVVIENKAKKQLVFVINKLMWMACLFISVAFVSLSFVVVGSNETWLAVYTALVGGVIMVTTIGTMCYCVVRHRLDESKMRNIRRTSTLSKSFSLSRQQSDPDLLNPGFKMYAV